MTHAESYKISPEKHVYISLGIIAIHALKVPMLLGLIGHEEGAIAYGRIWGKIAQS